MMIDCLTYRNFFKGKRVLITGHTGFKGSWLCLLLNYFGAKIYGYSLMPPTEPNMYEAARVNEIVESFIFDIRDREKVLKIFKSVKPEIVFHMAAQPLVLESYQYPVETYETNVMGTINLLEAVRVIGGVKSCIIITTDKCYDNKEWLWGYRENEPLGGYDPYSSSKSCCEIAVSSYRNSFFNPDYYNSHKTVLSTVRAGNVIGGGDWARDRLIPDFLRAISKGDILCIRNPKAIRPWQHVLEPLSGYIRLAYLSCLEGVKHSTSYNFGPNDDDTRTVEWIAEYMCKLWGKGAQYKVAGNSNAHEATYLKLDCSKAKFILGWKPKWNIDKALRKVIEWHSSWLQNEDIASVTIKQIEEYFNT